jgi:phage terminase small subunit
MAKAREKLTEIRKAFCREYVIDFNGTQATIRAGYSQKGASTQATRLLANACIQKEIKRLTEKACKKAGVTLEEVLQELKFVAMSRATDVAKWTDKSATVFDSDKLSEQAKASVCEVSRTTTMDGKETVKIKQHPKVPALGKLLDYLTMSPEGDGGPMEAPNLTLNFSTVSPNKELLKKVADAIGAD